jgi:hypothetical protein
MNWDGWKILKNQFSHSFFHSLCLLNMKFAF